ncbi:hypothetical protein GGS20DRAFT_451904 [Poronia punctata]|nr:hypothetical protein GGS20DRAFT_451904 [Poronia punctata]
MARPLWPHNRTIFLPPHHLYLFPLISGSVWFLTITILLLRWLSLGRPRYPGQVNPDIPMISDIAAQTFQPVFIVGSALTGISFLGTVFAVHHVRYARDFYALTNDKLWRQGTSLAALGTGVLAAGCLVFLSIFDTYDAHLPHRYLLMGTFGGLFMSALLTSLVWWDQTRGPVVFVGLRKWCIFNVALVIAQFVVGVLFVSLMYSGYYHAAGILEWSLTYLGAVWLLSFVGYTRFREGEKPWLEDVEGERRPLLE